MFPLRNFCLGFWSIFELYCWRLLRILRIKTTAGLMFGNIFCPSLGCIFNPMRRFSYAWKFFHYVFEGQCLYFSLFSVLLVWYLRHYHQIQGHENVQLFFLLRFYSLAPNFSLDSSSVNFHAWYEVRPPSRFCTWGLGFAMPFVGSVLGPVTSLSTSISNQVKTEVRICCWVLKSIPWSVCLCYCRNTHLQDNFVSSVSLEFHMNIGRFS